MLRLKWILTIGLLGVTMAVTTWAQTGGTQSVMDSHPDIAKYLLNILWGLLTIVFTLWSRQLQNMLREIRDLQKQDHDDITKLKAEHSINHPGQR